KEELKENRTYITKEKILSVERNNNTETLSEQNNNTSTHNEEVIEVNIRNEEVFETSTYNEDNIQTTTCDKEVSETSTEGTACWASQVEENEFLETNKKNISFLNQNEARNSAKKSTNLLQVNNKQQWSYMPSDDNLRHMSGSNTSEHTQVDENTVQPQQSVTNNVATTYNKK
ncbi:16442_t:CDS:2, partial [Cetraspora pellucida]